jgi:hypothetical protein
LSPSRWRNVINDTSPLSRRPARWQARAPDPCSRQEEPLRWDLLSQGWGLFLKQTLPEKPPGGSTRRRLVSEPPAARVWSPRCGGASGGADQESAHPYNVITARTRSRTLTRGNSPCRAGSPNRSVDEQVRRLRFLTPHNQRIVTPMLQHDVQGCRHPRAVLLAFGFRAI